VPFTNPIVGGVKLIRQAIQSPNYVPGVSGWTINRDGTAEFSGVTLRGELYIGNPPSPPNPYIHGTVLSGIPTIAIYDGTHANPARIQGFDLGGDGGMVLDSGDPAGDDTSLALGATFGELFYEDAVGGVSGLVHVGQPSTSMVQLRATGGGARDLELGLDQVNATPDAIGGRLYTRGEILHNDGIADENYCSRVVDGKAPGVSTATTVGTTETNISTANITNVYVEEGYAYRVIVHIDHRMDTLGMRLDYKLWNGTVGTGAQLGGTNRRWCDVATLTNFNGVVLYFLWRATATETIANMNLSAEKAVGGGGVAVVQVNNAFIATVEKIGMASKITNL
jgi:hypothetical protein